MTRLEIELSQKAVKMFKASAIFKRLLKSSFFNKIMELYEILLCQIQSVDPDFHLDKVEDLSNFLQWKKDQAAKKAPPPEDKDGSSSEGQDNSSAQSYDAL